jgi:hypothetical protein
MEQEVKDFPQDSVKTKNSFKKITFSNKKIIIILIIFIVLNFLVYSFLNSYLSERVKLENENTYEEEISQIKEEISKLRNNVTTVKNNADCEKETEEKEKMVVNIPEVSIDVDFYDEYTQPIEVPEICSDCTIREVGEVLQTYQLPEDLYNFKYLVVTCNIECLDCYQSNYLGIARLLVNDDYSKVYFFEGDSSHEVEEEFNSELIFNKDYLPILSNSLLPGNLDKVEYIETDKEFYFSLGHNTLLTPEDTEEISVDEFDEYTDSTIYVDSVNPSKYYILSNEKFYYTINFLPSIALGLEWGDPLPIIWEDEIENIYNYDYGYDGCSGVGLRVSDITKEELKITGTEKNVDNPIYEYLDTENENLKKLYEEDYLPYMSNFDDQGNYDETQTPMTYEEYLLKHPIIFWEDQIGRMIMFYNTRFIAVGGCAKPIVYLYPEIKRNIIVKVVPNQGNLTFTYPEYNGFWDVSATNDGIITDSSGNTHDYLWWESKSDYLDEPENGFIVKYDNLNIFFDNILMKAGFIKSEIDDFKEYWIPVMQSEYSPYFKISFLQNQEVDRIAKLIINPIPTTEIRLFMIYNRLNKPEQIKPQEIKQTYRKGFVVTEWGGTKR